MASWDLSPRIEERRQPHAKYESRSSCGGRGDVTWKWARPDVGTLSIYKVVSTQGPGRYLLVEKGEWDPATGTARVLDDGDLYQPFRFQSIIARGYWEEHSLPDDELDELLAEAFEVPAGAAVAIPPRRGAQDAPGCPSPTGERDASSGRVRN